MKKSMWRHGSSTYTVPWGSGIVSVVAMIGMAIALMDTPGVRYFMGLVFFGAVAVALVLQWGRRSRSGSLSRSLTGKEEP